ncbi:MAG TPA: Rho termination factor N-terminal domain-containing protein, partial [Candidatus Angelobacter sp.]|nr:Rho termination factor N-terminal domain-containing protein [Candidatus Angelobacter sp.]
MTETTQTDSTPAPRKSGGLSAMLLPELKSLAGQLGIPGASGMRKADLVSAISVRQVPASHAERPATAEPGEERPRRAERANGPAPAPTQDGETIRRQEEPDRSPTSTEGGQPVHRAERGDRAERPRRDRGAAGERPQGDGAPNEPMSGDAHQGDRQLNDRGPRDRQQGDRGQNDRGQNDRQQGDRGPNDRGQNDRQQQGAGDRPAYDDDDRGGRSRRRRRGRDRDRFADRDDRGPRQVRDRGARGPRGFEGDVEVSEDDVLLPVAGILDIMDSYAFVRTSGYLPGHNDVYVSLAMVKRFGLRKGDAVTGTVRQPREGEKTQKFNPLVKVETVNGADPEQSRNRVDFSKLTPLYPQERLRLETTPGNLVTRVIDLVAPIGKGQRGLIVSPPKAGKTMVLQAIANAITVNNPEVHLMVVLVDERPEEVTDMQRSV